MMSRVRRTARQKSPQPIDVPGRPWVTQGARRATPQSHSKFGSSTTAGGGSPLFTHKMNVTAGGLGNMFEESKYSGLAVHREKQRSLLQTVIHNLVDSNDETEREHQRNQLQNDKEIASERLDGLVTEHRDKLHGTVSTFQEVDEKIKESQAKIASVKASLTSCKTLLRCKRDELKRLWLEDVKYKNMLQMVASIEEVKAVPDLMIQYKREKYFLTATELLNNSVARLEHDLANVDALKELKQELRLQKESLHEELIDELHRHLYIRATAKKPNPLQLAEIQTSPSQGRKTGTLSRIGKTSQKSPPSQDQFRDDDDQVREEMIPGVDPEEDSVHYMAILVESLSTLGRVQEALDAIQTRMVKEFLLIIERVSVQVVRVAEQETMGLLGQGKKRKVLTNSPKLLTKMLKACFKKFQDVVSAHAVLLVHLHRAKRIYNKNFKLYEESEVWGAIQQVLQNVLEMYLAFDEEDPSLDALSGGMAISGVEFFTSYVRPKKHSSRTTKKSFFRFESSRHAISVSSYMREQRDIELVEGGGGVESMTTYADDQPSISQHLVCKPANRNITVVFGPVKEFIAAIEDALGLQLGDHCQLHNFLQDYVEENFLERVRIESFSKMGACVKPESARSIAPDQKAIKVTAKQYVLNSVLTLWQLVEDIRQLMKDLPMYSANFLGILCELLIGYRDSLQLFYRELTSVIVEAGKGSGGGGPETIVSSRWARDEDINRMISDEQCLEVSIKGAAVVSGAVRVLQAPEAIHRY